MGDLQMWVQWHRIFEHMETERLDRMIQTVRTMVAAEEASFEAHCDKVPTHIDIADWADGPYVDLTNLREDLYGMALVRLHASVESFLVNLAWAILPSMSNQGAKKTVKKPYVWSDLRSIFRSHSPCIDFEVFPQCPFISGLRELNNAIKHEDGRISAERLAGIPKMAVDQWQLSEGNIPFEKFDLAEIHSIVMSFKASVIDHLTAANPIPAN